MKITAKHLSISLFILLSVQLSAQVNGKVYDAENGKPINAASVFLNGTSAGTTTNASGFFEIKRILNGSFQFIVSCIGYETYKTTVSSAAQPITLEIKLKPASNTLNEVVVTDYDKDGFKKWGDLFIQKFLGSSTYSAKCKILNTDALHFKKNKTSNILSVSADEDIIIENGGLGYIIHYKLESFKYNFTSGLYYYSGYPFFEEMPRKKKNDESRWTKVRKECYFGSMLQFMRSLYNNRLSEDGFEIIKAIKPGEEDEHPIVLPTKKDTGSENVFGEYPKNNQALRESDIVYRPDSNSCILLFSDYVRVNYLKKPISVDYLSILNNPAASRIQSSELYMPNRKPVTIFSNGCYINPHDLMNLGYWAWSENISTLLPFDYVPE